MDAVDSVHLLRQECCMLSPPGLWPPPSPSLNRARRAQFPEVKEITHLHTHVIPTHPRDGLVVVLGIVMDKADLGRAAAVASRLQLALHGVPGVADADIHLDLTTMSMEGDDRAAAPVFSRDVPCSRLNAGLPCEPSGCARSTRRWRSESSLPGTDQSC